MRPTRTVWARIEEALIDLKLPATQAYAAGLAGVKQPSVNAWNKSGKYPDMKIAVKLADRLDVSVQWLLTEEGPKRVPPANDAHLDALYRAWSKLEDIDKRDLVGLASLRADMREAQQASIPAKRKA